MNTSKKGPGGLDAFRVGGFIMNTSEKGPGGLDAFRVVRTAEEEAKLPELTREVAKELLRKANKMFRAKTPFKHVTQLPDGVVLCSTEPRAGHLTSWVDAGKFRLSKFPSEVHSFSSGD